MSLNQQAVLDQIDSVLNQCQALVRARYDDLSDMPDDASSEAASLLLSAIERLAPPDSGYVKNARTHGQL